MAFLLLLLVQVKVNSMHSGFEGLRSTIFSPELQKIPWAMLTEQLTAISSTMVTSSSSGLSLDAILLRNSKLGGVSSSLSFWLVKIPMNAFYVIHESPAGIELIKKLTGDKTGLSADISFATRPKMTWVALTLWSKAKSFSVSSMLGYLRLWTIYIIIRPVEGKLTYTTNRRQLRLPVSQWQTH